MLKIVGRILGLSKEHMGLGFIWVTVAASVIFALAILNILLWLVSNLWSVSVASPFGLFGFLGAILVALAIGAAVWWRLTAKKHTKIQRPPGRWPIDPFPKPNPPEERKRSPQQPAEETALSIKARIQSKLSNAEETRSAAGLEQIEPLLQQLARKDPASEGWVRSMRWEAEQLKKRL